MNRKRILIGLGLVALTAAPSFALLGLPQWVMDPTAWARIAFETREVIAVKNATENTVKQLRMDAEIIRSKGYWKGMFTSLVNTFVLNQRGETAGWNAAINTGSGAQAAWYAASIPLRRNPNLTLGTPQAANTATAEIGAGAMVSAMSTLGNTRITQQSIRTPIANCENAALTTDHAYNTHSALQNITNACLVLELRQQQSAMSLQAAQLDLEIARAKPLIDTQAEYANMMAHAQQAQAVPMAPGNMAETITNRQPR